MLFPFPLALFPFPFPSWAIWLLPFPWDSHGNGIPMGFPTRPLPCTPLVVSPQFEEKVVVGLKMGSLISPVLTSYPLPIVTVGLSLTVFAVLRLVTDSTHGRTDEIDLAKGGNFIGCQTVELCTEIDHWFKCKHKHCCSCRWRFWRLWRCRWWRLIRFILVAGAAAAVSS